jgi:predicted PurR-regulated permease PerM
MLSPLIYSATVKLHPVLILSSLYIMEHSFGLQGVFLAVPITMYVIQQLVFDEKDKPLGGKHKGAKLELA